MKITELKHLGLSEKEAKVYLATLELGYASVQGIARKAGTNRVAVYQVLDTLKIKGLIDTTYKGKRKVYVATNPSDLVNILEEKKKGVSDEIDRFKSTMLPELLGLFNKSEGKPKVLYYDFEEGRNIARQYWINSKDNDFYQIDSLLYSESSVLSKTVTPKEIAAKIYGGDKRWTSLIYYKDKKVLSEYVQRVATLPGNIKKGYRYLKAESDNTYGCTIFINEDKVYIYKFPVEGQGFVLIVEDKFIAATVKALIKGAYSTGLTPEQL